MNPATGDNDLKLINGTRRRILLVEDHWADLLPLFRDDVVPRAGPLELFFLGAVATEHIDEALIVAYGLVLEILVGGI